MGVIEQVIEVKKVEWDHVDASRFERPKEIVTLIEAREEEKAEDAAEETKKDDETGGGGA
jgi:hypothetical protein